MTERVRLTADDAEKIRAATIQNIVAKIKKGGTPTAAEQKLIDQSTKSSFMVCTATTAELEDCFGVTKQYLGQMQTEGIIRQIEKNTWPVYETVRAYVEKLRNKRKNQWDSGGDNAEYEVERALLTKAKREAAQINTEVLKGRVHEGEAVRTLWVDMLMNCRSKLLALPTKAAPMIADKDRIAEAQALLEEMINEALSELAEYNPQRIAERTDLKRLNMSVVPGDSDAMGAASETDDQ